MEELLDLVADFAVGNFDVVFSGAVVGHEGEETIVSDIKLQSHISLAVTLLRLHQKLTSWYSWRRTLGTSML